MFVDVRNQEDILFIMCTGLGFTQPAELPGVPGEASTALRSPHDLPSAGRGRAEGRSQLLPGHCLTICSTRDLKYVYIMEVQSTKCYLSYSSYCLDKFGTYWFLSTIQYKTI